MKILMVELTNRCNMNCWFCPHSKMKREQGDMSMETVKKVIEKSHSHVVLHNLGESLLHPHFFEIAALFNEAGKHTTINVNSVALNETLVEKLLSSDISVIRVSMDYATERENLLCREMCDDKRTSFNLKGGYERERYTQFRERWGKKAVISGLHDFCNRTDNIKIDTLPKTTNCIFLKGDLGTVLWNGDVVPCCFDYEGEHIFGTIDDVDSFGHRGEYPICEKCVDFLSSVR